MAKKTNSTRKKITNTKKPVAKSKKTTKKSLVEPPKFSRKYFAIFGVVFALIGSYFLYSAFAAQKYVNYYGTLKSRNQTATYKLSTGAGQIDLLFSNNTADLNLKITNSKGKTIGSVDSRGRRAVKFTTQVSPDTYTFYLSSDKAFGNKGYSVKINYPEQDTVAPTIAIIDPLNQESVSKTSFMSARVSDNATITKVVMYVNDKLIKDDYEAPYDSRWDTRKFPDGPVTISMKAYDDSGNVGEASGTIVIDNIEEPIEVSRSRFPGDPNPRVNGKVYWGSSVGGNGDPAPRHEDPTGKSLSIRRSFYQWNQALNPSSAMYKNIESDLANNRLPFVSTKTPRWQDVADGKHDAELDQIIARLEAYGKPVWFVVHHEPEGGGGKNFPDDPGGAKAWREMQIKVRQRLNKAQVKNVAFMPVMMAYTWEPSSNRNPDDWWVDGIWDAYCVDLYQGKESADGMIKSNWQNFVKWAEARNVPYCVGEWGNRGTNQQAGQEMRDFWEWTFKNNKDMIAYTYFDSDTNPGEEWPLEGEPLKVFRDILKNDSRVQRIDEL